MSLQIVTFGILGETMSSVLLLLFVMTNPPTNAAAVATVVTDTTIVVVDIVVAGLDAGIPHEVADAAVPLALTPEAHDVTT
jgi:hypothetical protein